jgi:cytochrome c oxidase cbb3-type subunit 3
MSSRSEVLVLAVALSCSCEREQRRFSEPPEWGEVNAEIQTASALRPADLVDGGTPPGHGAPVHHVIDPYEHNAWAAAEGKRLWTWFNCSGCHASGGGGMGPPLMDEQWTYGWDPVSIYATILEGRPNGMPAFRGKLTEQQVWQLVAYVRSLSGQLRIDVAPSRDDGMAVKSPESMTAKERPRPADHP